MATLEEIKELKEQEFRVLLGEIQKYLKQNPNHVGTIAKTDRNIGRKLYYFSEIRKGKKSHTIYNEKHFQALDKILPEWDNYGLSRLNFGEFCEQLKIFTKAKNAYYDKHKVPEVLRDLHVPEEYKNGKYALGRRMYRIKAGITPLTEKQIQIINKINSDCLNKVCRFDVARFYIELRNFVAEKDKEYDRLNIPVEMRDYAITHSTVIGDYKLGSRFRYFKANWKNLTEEQQKHFNILAPTLFEKKKKTSFGIDKFFMDYATFVENKNKYYDKLGTPAELRSYSISRNEEINGDRLGERLHYVKTTFPLTPKQEKGLDKLNPKWREKPVAFDFGEFYGQLLQFRKQRNNEYDKLNVPQEKRAYTVFSSTYMGNYQLGINLYLIRTGKIKISNTEKEYLLKLYPNCFVDPNKKAVNKKQPKNQEQERV